MTDLLRIAHPQNCPPYGNSRVGICEGNHKVNIVDKKSSSDSLSLNPDTLVPIPTILGSASMKKLSNLSRRKMGTSATSPEIKVS